MVKLEELLEFLEELWPFETADDWDKPGLSVGSRSSEVSTLLLSVDITRSVVEEAVALGADLIISHHPLLLRGVHDVSEESLKGEIITLAIKNNIALFAAHTNADKAEVGTARALAAQYGLKNLRVLDQSSGHGLVGDLQEPISLVAFATRIAKQLPPTAAGVKVAGDPETLISKVALSPGAGDSFLAAALGSGADVYVTSDLRHHPAQDFVEAPGKQVALIDVSHWASEHSLLGPAAGAIANRFSDLRVHISEIRTDPWDFAVMQ